MSVELDSRKVNSYAKYNVGPSPNGFYKSTISLVKENGMVQIRSVISFFSPREKTSHSAEASLKQKSSASGYVADPITVDPNKMCSLDSLKEGATENAVYELMFATKAGLPLPNFPVSHSAIALRDDKDRFAVYGRQSPYNFTMWLDKGFKIRTKKDNEMPYLNKGFNFTAYPTGVFFSKEEMEYCLNEADRLINEKQSCNMVNSNCYSYSVTVMALAIQQLLERPILDSAAISRIISVMEGHPLSDHCAFGVFNNPVVVDKLVSVNKQIQARLGAIDNKSEEDFSLVKQSLALSKKIEEEAPKLRILSALS